MAKKKLFHILLVVLDRVRSDIEYEVNIKAELEIAHLHEKTDRIYENMLERFTKLERMLPVASHRT